MVVVASVVEMAVVEGVVVVVVVVVVVEVVVVEEVVVEGVVEVEVLMVVGAMVVEGIGARGEGAGVAGAGVKVEATEASVCSTTREGGWREQRVKDKAAGTQNWQNTLIHTQKNQQSPQLKHKENKSHSSQCTSHA